MRGVRRLIADRRIRMRPYPSLSGWGGGDRWGGDGGDRAQRAKKIVEQPRRATSPSNLAEQPRRASSSSKLPPMAMPFTLAVTIGEAVIDQTGQGYYSREALNSLRVETIPGLVSPFRGLDTMQIRPGNPHVWPPQPPSGHTSARPLQGSKSTSETNFGLVSVRLLCKWVKSIGICRSTN